MFLRYTYVKVLSEERMIDLLALLYIIAGYWATGKTIYANKIIIHSFGALFIQRLILGVLLGWILIPVAIVRTIFKI